MQPSPPAERRPDLDWIRVGAFLLLILYHVGMFYVPWDWHVKSPRQVAALEPLMLLTNPWRLDLLFLVSGAATRFIADRTSAGALAKGRTWRLLPPLVFAMLVVVPPQSYLEIREQAPQLLGSIPDFYVKYVTASGHWCDKDGCLITPTWNHMWFVAYLLAYTLVLAAALAAWPGLGPWLQRQFERLGGLGLIAGPILFLALLRATLQPIFGLTHEFYNDWYNHALSVSFFLFGFGYAKSEALAARFEALRWPAAGVWLVGYLAFTAYAWTWRSGSAPPEGLRLAMNLFYGAETWAAVAAILGFGRRWLTRSSLALHYLSRGIFPFYIVHQTIIIVAAHNLAQLRWPIGLEAATLVALTFAGCFATYEVVRRAPALRPVFGLKGAGRTGGRFSAVVP